MPVSALSVDKVSPLTTPPLLNQDGMKLFEMLVENIGIVSSGRVWDKDGNEDLWNLCVLLIFRCGRV